MPGYKGHLGGGFLIAVIALAVVAIFLNPLSIARCIELSGCCMIGALFPDIDTKSKGQILFYRLFFIFFVVLLLRQYFQVAAFMGFLLFVPILSRHRGLFHRIWFLSLGALAIGLLIMLHAPDQRAWLFGNLIFFYLGALSHVWLDIGLRGIMR